MQGFLHPEVACLHGIRATTSLLIWDGRGIFIYNEPGGEQEHFIANGHSHTSSTKIYNRKHQKHRSLSSYSWLTLNMANTGTEVIFGQWILRVSHLREHSSITICGFYEQYGRLLSTILSMNPNWLKFGFSTICYDFTFNSSLYSQPQHLC